MTKEQKDLLLKDLCARLPYGMKCYIPEINDYRILGTVQYDGENTLFDFWDKNHKIYEHQLYISEFKPYLLPLSSMTEEQKKEYNSLCCFVPSIHYELEDMMTDAIDYLIENHFDYRGLIPMGLANDATGLNIY